MKESNSNDGLFPFFERVQKLRWIERCSNTQHMKSYSVAQHSFYMALYGIIFAGLENKRLDKEYYDLGLVASKAIIHDIEESETGDILFPLHNDHPVFKKKLDFIRTACIDNEVFKEISYPTGEYFKNLWKTAKDNSPEGNMVACMDKFEILMFAVSELEVGNSSIKNIYNNSIRILYSDFFNIKSVIEVVKELEIRFGCGC